MDNKDVSDEDIEKELKEELKKRLPYLRFSTDKQFEAWKKWAKEGREYVLKKKLSDEDLLKDLKEERTKGLKSKMREGIRGALGSLLIFFIIVIILDVIFSNIFLLVLRQNNFWENYISNFGFLFLVLFLPCIVLSILVALKIS